MGSFKKQEIKKVEILMYRWAGKKFFLEIKSPCEECDLNTAILKDMQQSEFRGKNVEVKLEPWLTCLWQALRHGGWHAPVVVVNGKLFSQGIVIDRKKLANLVQSKLEIN